MTRFRISLAGAQEKTALLRHGEQWLRPRGATPTTHILKLPLGMVGSMQARLQHVGRERVVVREDRRGVRAASCPCEIAEFEDQRVLVVERFDRRPRARWGVVDATSPGGSVSGDRHARRGASTKRTAGLVSRLS